MGSFLRPKSPQNLADEDYIRYKKNKPVDPEEILKEIKSANLGKIKKYDKLFDDSLSNKNICVFGNKDSILEIKGDFDKIIDLTN